MIINNRYNFPAVFVRMAQKKNKKSASYATATSLLKPVRQFWLSRRHFDEIEVDVIDMMYQLNGDAVHLLLSTYSDSSEITEERLAMQLEGRVISGQADLYTAAFGEPKAIIDWKTTSAWTLVYKSRMVEWETQLNIYAELYRQAGFEVDVLRTVAVLRDWKEEKANEPGYPPHPVVTIEFTPWPREKAMQEIRTRLDAIIKAEALADDDLPVCTPEERWNKGDKFAVKKKTLKRAVRVLDSEQEANDFIAAQADQKGLVVERRPGEDTRCASYCDACKFCSYWKENVATAFEKEGNE